MSDGTDKINRSVLPIPTPPRTGLITYDAKDPESKYPVIEQLLNYFLERDLAEARTPQPT
ncbi:MAG: hypothetical protein EOR04_16775 [Mesorhizobium sp.]|uniref:hypothetical protein n=1 Tax=Mesorhizobium sp. TaxID=1871066 RepID=UPI000FE4ACC8|nr:hypothetical protein [Mesorhizobium sp.]RWP41089.1 MAG: hypothetical protein EOR04_16775 [Mesorhizobium sp.]